MNLLKNLTATGLAPSLARSFSFQIALGVLVMVAFANVQIPMHPVPITLHTVGVMILALLYSPFASLASVASYILLALAGAPVLSDFSGGFSVATGMTFGYLIGMMLCAPVVGIMYRQLQIRISNKYLPVLFATFTGHVIIFLCGVGWLCAIIGFKQAFYSGFFALMPTGMAKMILFAMLFAYIKGWRADCGRS